MHKLPVPKTLAWKPTLPQTYKSTHQKLLVSGGCFASGTNQIKFAASWPGYVKDMCRFDYAIDLSYPGVGNGYVADSVMHYLDSVGDEKREFLVIVMWTIIAWAEVKTPNSTKQPLVGNTNYSILRRKPTTEDLIESSQLTFDKIFELKSYLETNNITYSFMQFGNKLFENQVPTEKLSCSFNDYLSNDQIEKLKSINWMPSNPSDCFYDFSIRNNHVEEHHQIAVESHFKWTKDILLPEMCKRNLISKI